MNVQCSAVNSLRLTNVDKILNVKILYYADRKIN